jgi:hypothetical protein
VAINWSRLLADPNVLAVIEKMVTEKVESFQPSVDQNGEIIFGELNGILGRDSFKVLEELATASVLSRRSESRLLSCPVHEGSFDLTARLKCTGCSSMLLRKGSLMQHACGYIGAQEAFGTNCPKCGKPAAPQSLKAMGTWYECEGCKSRFASPNVYLYCSKHNHDFPIQQAKLMDQPSFRLTPEAAEELRSRLGTLIMITRGLRAKNLQVQISGTIQGASGVQHAFDLVIQDDSNKIPVDVNLSTKEPVGIVAVLATYAKALDTQSKTPVLIAIPSASEDAKKSASAYGLLLIEGAESSSIVQQLKEFLDRVKAKNEATVKV